MGFWIFMTAMTLLVPGILISVGAWMEKHPPEEINWIYGYRTGRSMKNQEAWDFANRYGGKLMRRAGWVTLVISVCVMALTLFQSDDVISAVSVTLIFCQLIPTVGVIPVVERQLRKRFDSEGNPKEEIK